MSLKTQGFCACAGPPLTIGPMTLTISRKKLYAQSAPTIPCIPENGELILA